MSEYETWSLIVSGLAAAGTLAAVIISLVATLWPKTRFKIHLIDVIAIKQYTHIEDDGYDVSHLRFDVENKMDVQMQVFDARIHFKGSENNQAITLGFDETFVPPKSRYNVQVPLAEKCVKNGVCSNASKVVITLGTSFGEKTGTVKNESLLCDVIESEDEFTAVPVTRGAA